VIDTNFVSPDFGRVRNVTVSMDEPTAEWARVQASKSGQSLSRWLGDRLRRDRDLEDRRAAAAATIDAILDGPLLSLSEDGRIFDRAAHYDEVLRERLPGHIDPSLPAGSARSGEAVDGEDLAHEAAGLRPARA
jgi:hypothetical protein